MNVHCECVATHRPTLLRTQEHHLWPKYLGGPPHPATLVELCATTHDQVHSVLRAMILAGRWLPRTTGRWPRYAHQLATLGFQAWDAAGRPTPLA